MLGLLRSDGPVLNVDDDARISPELLDRIWRVDKLIAWPVGNMYPEGCKFCSRRRSAVRDQSADDSRVDMVTGEGLMCEGGKQHHWRLGWIPERVFPIEYVRHWFFRPAALKGHGR